VRRYVWEEEYEADSYVAVLDTYSGHRAMTPEVRDELYREVRALIGGRRLRKVYLAILHVARRRS